MLKLLFVSQMLSLKMHSSTGNHSVTLLGDRTQTFAKCSKPGCQPLPPHLSQHMYGTTLHVSFRTTSPQDPWDLSGSHLQMRKWRICFSITCPRPHSLPVSSENTSGSGSYTSYLQPIAWPDSFSLVLLSEAGK